MIFTERFYTISIKSLYLWNKLRGYGIHTGGQGNSLSPRDRVVYLTINGFIIAFFEWYKYPTQTVECCFYTFSNLFYGRGILTQSRMSVGIYICYLPMTCILLCPWSAFKPVHVHVCVCICILAYICMCIAHKYKSTWSSIWCLTIYDHWLQTNVACPNLVSGTSYSSTDISIMITTSLIKNQRKMKYFEWKPFLKI